MSQSQRSNIQSLFRERSLPKLGDPEQTGAARRKRAKNIVVLPLAQIRVDEKQVRKSKKGPEHRETKELAASIKEHGLLQQLIVRKDGEGYVIISGERRYHACKLAGLTEVPCMIKNVSQAVVDEIQLIENIQREDLNAVEIGLHLRKLADHGAKLESLVTKTGKSKPWVSRHLSIATKLAADIQEEITLGSVEAPPLDSLYQLSMLSQQQQTEAWRAIRQGGLNRQQIKDEVIAPLKQTGAGKSSKRGYTKTIKIERQTITVKFPKQRVSASEVVATLEAAVQKLQKAEKAAA